MKLKQFEFSSDTVPCVLIKSWNLDGEWFDGDILAGPMPTLFLTNPPATLEAIIAAPEKVRNPKLPN